jgi:hypothetical protein
MSTKDFIRSEENKGALLNTNNEALAAYKRARELRWKAQDQDKKIEKVEEELSEIKQLLQKILEKQGG